MLIWLILEVREKVMLCLWNKLVLILLVEQCLQLEMLLGLIDCSCLFLLELLKKGFVIISGLVFNEVIECWKILNDFGLYVENLSIFLVVCLKNFVCYVGMILVFNIVRMLLQKRMVVLVVFVFVWEMLVLDDVLDVLDVMLVVIICDVRKIGQKKWFCLLKDLDKFVLVFVSVCLYLLKEEILDELICVEVFSYIFR